MSSAFNPNPSEFNYDAVVNNDRTIPSNLRFSNLTPMGLVSTAKKFIFRPTNQNVFSENNNVIQIPIASSTSVIDPQLTYFKFTLENKDAANDMQIDNCIDTIIAGFRLFSRNGGVDAETLRYYNQLIAILYDTEFNAWKRHSLKTIQGFGNGLSVVNSTVNITVPAIPAAIPAGGIAAANVVGNTTSNLNSSRLGTGELVLAHGEKHTFCMPFLSSLIGLLQTKYFLTPLMGHCDLEIVLNPNFYISSANAKIPWEVSGFEMHCQLISFQDPIIERLKAVAATTGIYIHGQQWSGYKEAISANTNTIVISERLRSVNNVLLAFSKDRTDYRIRQQARKSNRLSSLQLKIGDNLYPSQPIRGEGGGGTRDIGGVVTDVEGKLADNSEFLCEYYKSMCLLHNVNNCGIIDGYNFAYNDDSKFNHDRVGRAVYGIEISSFSKPENPIECGIDLNANGPLNIMFTSNEGTQCYAYVFMNYDVVYSILQDGRFVVAK
jgi:hypothetical protein